MRRLLSALVLAAAVAAAAVLLLAGPKGDEREPRLPPDFQRGVSLTGYHRDEYAGQEAHDALRAAHDLGADSVTLTPAWYQPDAGSSEIAPDAERTPSAESVEAIAGEARDLGMHVTLKPHLNVADGTFRGSIEPRDVDAWFASYAGMLGFYADMARRAGADQLAVGTELERLSGHTERWLRLIEMVRARFDGRLTYAANSDEVHRVRFWGALDAIGVDAYYPLSKRPDPPVAALVKAWRRPIGDLGRLHQRYRKDVLLTEIGYPSADSAVSTPYEERGRPDRELQARAVEAALTAWSKVPWLAGMSWWEWSSEPSEITDADTGFALNGKPAAEAIRDWYAD